MKKLILFMMLAVAMVASFTSCSSKGDEPTPPPQEVDVKLDYAFFEQGSMSRSGESVYESFYNDYIKTKILAPYSYRLIFYVEDDVMADMEGPWSGAGIRLKEGNYKVQGYSNPKIHSNDASGEYVCDSLFLDFNEPVSITKTTEKVTLSAKYNCFLLLFNAENIKSITASFGNKKLAQAGNVYYLFVRQNYYVTSSYTTWLSLNIVKKDGTKISYSLKGNDFEKGKYYYFNDMTNSFDIDPMVNGN